MVNRGGVSPEQVMFFEKLPHWVRAPDSKVHVGPIKPTIRGITNKLVIGAYLVVGN